MVSGFTNFTYFGNLTARLAQRDSTTLMLFFVM